MTARWAAMNGSRGWLQSMSLAVLLAGTILLAGISLAAPRHAQPAIAAPANDGIGWIMHNHTADRHLAVAISRTHV